MTRFLALALLGVLVFPAHAQSLQCGPRSDMLAGLKRSFAEEPRIWGTSNGGGVLEILVSKTGTWTVVVSYPDGTACMYLSGEDWTAIPQPKGPRA